MGHLFVTGEDERLRQSHELEGKYGITERFEVIFEGVFEQSIGDDFEAEEIELGFEIVQPEGDGFALAFRTLYEFALRGGSVVFSVCSFRPPRRFCRFSAVRFCQIRRGLAERGRKRTLRRAASISSKCQL
jgi:hypothetical protein